MKRWRCPDCNAVHTVRPEGYPPGSQYPNDLKQEAVSAFIHGRKYLKSVPRQNQQNWRKAFNYQRRLFSNWHPVVEFFTDAILTSQKQISFCLKYRKVVSGLDPPYLSFAVTRNSS